MTKANVANVTIRPEESAHFAGLAREWWNPKGPMASLHQVNPVRLQFLRASIDAHWPGSGANSTPLQDKTVLDIGCGAGLLCEPLKRMGGDVTGVDAAAENASVASSHAEAMGLNIRYMVGEVSSLNIGTFDLVTCVEVIEHVADKRAFLSDVINRMAPGGLLVMSTPNRTAASRVLLVGAAEAIGYVPKGTHDWDDFITPEEFEALLAEFGLETIERRGIAYRPSKGLHLSEDESLNYILSARKI
ncbi:MAG: bifunctional 2-polyprenyl-6-hydroxyphenol methylase/3-demethylubiquinol 3-O-methyltransferase UbiG [Erythrobacter sp.]